jgi:hypothetical protein
MEYDSKNIKSRLNNRVIYLITITHDPLLSFIGEGILTWIYECVPKSFRTESINKYPLTMGITRWEAAHRVMVAKLIRLIHKIAIQLHLVAERRTICSSRSRQPVRKLRKHTRIPCLLYRTNFFVMFYRSRISHSYLFRFRINCWNYESS